MRSKSAFLFISVVILILCSAGLADVRLNGLFCDNMVIQRYMKVPVWGWAEPGEKVAVKTSWKWGAVKTVADKNGDWMVGFDAPKVGGPYEIEVTGNNVVTIKNVLCGDVWICSGQSNMAFSVGSANNAKEEIANSDYPAIRLLKVGSVVAEERQKDIKTKGWEVCGPGTVEDFSAVAYFFGRDLYKELGVPIGLIRSCCSSTPAEAWVSRETLEADKDLNVILEKVEIAMARYPQAEEEYKMWMEKWVKACAKAKAEGKQEPGQPQGPRGRDHVCYPTGLFNGSISPLMPYGIKGVLWYQGEANASRAYEYRKLLPAMIDNWRKEWGQGDFAFYLVELAPFGYWEPVLAEMRESQRMVADSVVNCGMAQTIDIGDVQDIHPKNKQEVGRRLAMVALAKTYGKKDVIYSGPVYKEMKVEGDKIRLFFNHLHGGLECRGDELTYFTIAGGDEKFVDAKAEIDGDTILVYSDKVKTPAAVRFAWGDMLVGNLFNKAGLPCSCFRTDGWAGITADRKGFVYSGPVYREMKIEGDKIKVFFDFAANGLVKASWDFNQFEIAGEDHRFYPANTEFGHDWILCSSDKVAKPIAVRYGWGETDVQNLLNKECMFAGPFRTDGWAGKEEVKAKLQNKFFEKLYSKTYYSLIDRIEDDGYIEESLTGAYDGMYPRTTGGVGSLLLETGDYESAKRLLNLDMQVASQYGMERLPHVIGKHRGRLIRPIADANNIAQVKTNHVVHQMAQGVGSAVSFVAGSDKPIKAIEAAVRSKKSTGKFVLSIRESADGEVLGSSEFFVTADMQDELWKRFVFTSPVKVEAGKKYYVRIDFEGKGRPWWMGFKKLYESDGFSANFLVEPEGHKPYWFAQTREAGGFAIDTGDLKHEPDEEYFIISDFDEIDGQAHVIMAWARLVTKTGDKEFEDKWYDYLAKITDRASDFPYFMYGNNPTWGFVDLVLCPSFEHSREYRFWQCYDILTQSFNGAAWQAMADVARRRGDMDHAKKWEDKLKMLRRGIANNLTGEVDGKKVYLEMRLPDGSAGKPMLDMGWVNFSPVAAQWEALDRDVLVNTVDLLRSKAMQTLADGTKWLPTDWYEGKGPSPEIIGKGIGWEIDFCRQHGQWWRIMEILDMLEKVNTTELYMEGAGYHDGKLIVKDAGNGEQTCWWSWAMARLRRDMGMDAMPKRWD